MMGRLHQFTQRWAVTVMVAVATGAVGFLIATSLQPVERRLVEYSTQIIVRVDPDTGVLSVPLEDGRTAPTIRLGDTVPTRGTVEVFSDSAVSVTGAIYWSEVPPGKRVLVVSGVARLFQPGVTILTFENHIPPEVAEAVLESGPSLWRIHGQVTVNEPYAVDASWETAAFWLES